MKRPELYLPSDSEEEQRFVRSSQSPTEASDERELPQLDTLRRPRKLRRATETPRERAIAAAEQHAHDDDPEVEALRSPPFNPPGLELTSRGGGGVIDRCHSGTWLFCENQSKK